MNQIKVPTPLGTLTAETDGAGITVSIINLDRNAKHPLVKAAYEPETDSVRAAMWNDAEESEPACMSIVKNLEKLSKMPIDDSSDIVYICCPYAGQTPDDREQNIENARRYGRFALSQGYVPYIAHLAICGFLNDDIQQERQLGIQADRVMLSRCKELWVFGDKVSKGMAAEIHTCQTDIKRTIRYFTDDCTLLSVEGANDE